MPLLVFAVTATSSFQAQPTGATALVVRSSDAGDTMNLLAAGSLTGSAQSDSVALNGQLEVVTADTFSALTFLKTATAPDGIVTVYQAGSKAWGDIRVDAQPSNNDTLTTGLGTTTQVYTFKTTLTGSANEIKIGADKYETARNICRALRAGTGSGSEYGTGTAANAFVSAWADSSFTYNDLNGTSEATVYIQDRVPASRQLTWQLSSDASELTLRAPSGGSTGALLAVLSAAAFQITQAMNFNNADLSQNNLVAALTPTTDALSVAGRQGTLFLKAANYTSAVTVGLEFSNDGTNFESVPADMLSDAIDGLDNNSQAIAILGNFEYLRLNFSVNANTVDVALHAILVIP